MLDAGRYLASVSRPKGGLTWADMWNVIGARALGSPIVKAKAGPLSRRDFTPTFTVE